MKRTKLKKKSVLRRKSKVKISVIQRNIWTLCKNLTRQKYGNKCYTCTGSNLIGSNWQTGHLWAKASLGAFLKYDLRVLRPQCYRCNMLHGGQGAVFYSRMLEENGKSYMKKLNEDRQVTVNAMEHYQKILTEYQLQWLKSGTK